MKELNKQSNQAGLVQIILPFEIIQETQESTPRNFHNIQQFLGSTHYYRKSVQNFEEIAHSLLELLGKLG